MYAEIYDYKIYDNGEIYSNKSNRFLKHDVDKHGYHQVTLTIDGQPYREKVHRLVAYFFCNPPCGYEKLTVDHIDGDKSNNSSSNLEWCTHKENNRRARENLLNNVSESNSKRWENNDFRERTSRNISLGKIASGKSKGRNNPMFRYDIYGPDGTLYDIHGLAKLLNMGYSGTYRLIRIYKDTGKIDKRLVKLGVIIHDVKDEGPSTIQSVSKKKAL